MKSHDNAEWLHRVHEDRVAKKATAAGNQRRRPKGVSRDDTGEVAVARQQVSESFDSCNLGLVFLSTPV